MPIWRGCTADDQEEFAHVRRISARGKVFAAHSGTNAAENIPHATENLPHAAENVLHAVENFTYSAGCVQESVPCYSLLVGQPEAGTSRSCRDDPVGGQVGLAVLDAVRDDLKSQNRLVARVRLVHHEVERAIRVSRPVMDDHASGGAAVHNPRPRTCEACQGDDDSGIRRVVALAIDPEIVDARGQVGAREVAAASENLPVRRDTAYAIGSVACLSLVAYCR